jgi:hypothetical protein
MFALFYASQIYLDYAELCHEILVENIMQIPFTLGFP